MTKNAKTEKSLKSDKKKITIKLQNGKIIRKLQKKIARKLHKSKKSKNCRVIKKMKKLLKHLKNNRKTTKQFLSKRVTEKLQKDKITEWKNHFKK